MKRAALLWLLRRENIFISAGSPSRRAKLSAQLRTIDDCLRQRMSAAHTRRVNMSDQRSFGMIESFDKVRHSVHRGNSPSKSLRSVLADRTMSESAVVNSNIASKTYLEIHLD
jgi:hypothetical protein